MGNRDGLWRIGFFMKKATKQKALRALLGLAIVLYLLLMPPVLAQGRGENFYRQNRLREKSEYAGTFVLYHVAREKTYQGSVTKFLKTLAEGYEKTHYGLHIEVVGMGEEEFLERLSMGREPDLVSFFSGQLPKEQLRSMDWGELPVLRPGLSAGEYVCPWLFSGYVYSAPALEAGEIAEGTGCYVSPLPGAYYKLKGGDMTLEDYAAGKAKGGLTDLRACGDLLHREQGGAWAAQPAGNFTDQVCYMGVFRRGREGSEECLQGFMHYVLGEKQQGTLSALGAFSVLKEGWGHFSAEVPDALEQTDRAYETVICPEPFLYYGHRAALLEEAQAFLDGADGAEKRFFERLHVVIQT